MAKKKKTPEIKLNSFDNISFDKAPDLDAAKSILEEKKEEEKKVEAEIKAPPVPTPSPVVSPPIEAAAPPKKVKQSTRKKATKPPARGTLPPANKKRTSFNVDATLHKALRDYCYYNEIEMVEYVFEQLVKSDLKKKGLYPPK